MSGPASKIALGTAQFGSRYGIANQAGRVDFSEIEAILGVCRDSGIRTLDTAAAYGDAESILGQVGVGDFRIVSKIRRIPRHVFRVSEWVVDQLEASLGRLGVAQLAGFMVHDTGDLDREQSTGIWEGLLSAKRQGMADSIGYSVYSPVDLERLWGRYPGDLIQLPLNALDRTHEQSGWLARLAESGATVHARSAFLQGLLLMNPEERPDYFSQFESALGEWDRWCAASRVSRLQAAVAVPLRNPHVEKVVVGVDSRDQLEEILQASEAISLDIPEISAPQQLLDPRLWKGND